MCPDLPVQGLLATLGVITIILGLPLQSTLGDAFSGIVLSFSRPYRAGDWVGGGWRAIISMTRPSVAPSMLRLRGQFSNWLKRRYDAVFFNNRVSGRDMREVG